MAIRSTFLFCSVSSPLLGAQARTAGPIRHASMTRNIDGDTVDLMERSNKKRPAYALSLVGAWQLQDGGHALRRRY